MTVEYVVMDAMPGVQHFRCDRMLATLAVSSCATMWRKANTSEGSCTACLRCTIGAEHAGETQASNSALHLAKVCARCHKPAARLIGKMHCVSCKNREYELDKGRNAKGTQPVKLRSLCKRRVRYLSGNESCTLTAARTLDSDELVVAVLRDSSQRVRFGLAVVSQPRMRQLRLF